MAKCAREFIDMVAITTIGTIFDDRVQCSWDVNQMGNLSNN